MRRPSRGPLRHSFSLVPKEPWSTSLTAGSELSFQGLVKEHPGGHKVLGFPLVQAQCPSRLRALLQRRAASAGCWGRKHREEVRGHVHIHVDLWSCGELTLPAIEGHIRISNAGRKRG